MKMLRKKNQLGFSLLEAMIGLAIGAASMVAFSTLFRIQSQTSIKNNGRGDFFNLTTRLREMVANPALCQQLFDGSTDFIPNGMSFAGTSVNIPIMGVGGLNLNYSTYTTY